MSRIEIPPECVALESALSSARQDVERAEHDLREAKVALQSYAVGDFVEAQIRLPGEPFLTRPSGWHRCKIEGIGLSRPWGEEGIYVTTYNVRRVLQSGKLAKHRTSVNDVRPLPLEES